MEMNEKEYASKGVAGTGLGLGIAGTALGLLTLAGRAGNFMCNGHQNESHEHPSSFSAWEKACNEKIEIMQAMYDHRNTDVAEKFSMYKGMRDSYDDLSKHLDESSFGLYKSQRDGFDAMSARISQLEKEVAVNSAIRPYQDRLLQCEIDKAYNAGINYTDRKTCRMIQGNLVLPSTPTTTGFQSVTCPCCQAQASAGTAS